MENSLVATDTAALPVAHFSDATGLLSVIFYPLCPGRRLIAGLQKSAIIFLYTVVGNSGTYGKFSIRSVTVIVIVIIFVQFKKFRREGAGEVRRLIIFKRSLRVYESRGTNLYFAATSFAFALDDAG